MIICDDFIVLNFPKTGSTFVRDMVKEIYRRRRPGVLAKIVLLALRKELPYKELMLPNYQSPNERQRHLLGQHGAYCQIPEEQLHKEILTVVRNPYDLFLANYLTEWWTWYFPAPEEQLKQLFPDFPKITLDEYLILSDLSANQYNGITLGPITTQFIRMYFKQPDKVLQTITDEYVQSDSMFLEDIGANITFIRQSELNMALSDFLCKHGFSDEETAFIRSHPKVNISINTTTDRNALWTKSAIEYMKKREAFLFRMLEKLGLRFDAPMLKQ